MIKFMNFMNQWEFMHVWMKFPKIRSYMHEFPFVHKIHKFDHGDDLVIMAMTGCWSCMKISFMAVFMTPKQCASPCLSRWPHSILVGAIPICQFEIVTDLEGWSRKRSTRMEGSRIADQDDEGIFLTAAPMWMSWTFLEAKARSERLVRNGAARKERLVEGGVD